MVLWELPDVLGSNLFYSKYPVTKAKWELLREPKHFWQFKKNWFLTQKLLTVRCETGKDLARALVMCGERRVSFLIQSTA